jgi:hypothetical protein
VNRARTEQLAHAVAERIDALVSHYWKLQWRLQRSVERETRRKAEFQAALSVNHTKEAWDDFFGASRRLLRLEGLLRFASNAHFALTLLLSPGELLRIACLSRFDWRENRYDIIWGAFPDEHRKNR